MIESRGRYAAMPRLPTKLIVFTIAFGFFWIHLAPKRAELATRILRKKREAGLQDSVQAVVERKIRADICKWADLCEYRPSSWEPAVRIDGHGVQVAHAFYADGNLRRFLFRIRYGAVSEVIDLR